MKENLNILDFRHYYLNICVLVVVFAFLFDAFVFVISFLALVVFSPNPHN